MNYLTKIKGRGRGLFLFLVMIVLLAPARMTGQNTLTVYDGSATNAYVPFIGSIDTRWQKTEYIIPASELTDMDGKVITQLNFRHSYYSYVNRYSSYKVFLKEVDFTTFGDEPSYQGLEGATVVYEGQLWPREYYLNVNFDTYYTYQGGNLLIGFYTSEIGSSSSQSYQYSYYGETVIGACLSGTANAMDDVAATQRDFIPKTTFTYYDADFCFEPFALSFDENSLTPTSVELDWTPRGNESAWGFEYSTDYGDTWSDLGVTADHHPFTLNNLQPGTEYYISVYAKCGDENPSEGSTSVFFATPFCNAVDQCEINYVLGDSYGDGWNGASIEIWYGSTFVTSLTMFSGGEWGDKSTSMEGSIPLCAGLNYTFMWASGDYDSECFFTIYDPSGDVLMSHEADEEFGEDLLMNYEMVCPTCRRPLGLSVEDHSSSSATLSWIATNGETNWEYAYSSDNEHWSQTQTVTGTPSCFISNLLPATQYYFRVRANCGDSDYSTWSTIAFYTDCGTITVDASHPYFENFDAIRGWGFYDEPGGHILPRCWDALNYSENDYEMYYPTLFGEHPYYDNIEGGEIGYKGSDDECETSYSCPTYMRFYASAASEQYAILPAMNNINGLQLKFMASLADVIGFQDTDFHVGVMTDPTDASSFTEIKSYVFSIPGYEELTVYFNEYELQPDVDEYYIAFKFVVQDGGYGEVYVDDVSVSVLPSCLAPYELTVSNVQENDATLTWSPNGNETAWQVRYSSDKTNWTTVDFTEAEPGETVTKLLDNLAHNTLYYVQVRANCGGSYSDWSRASRFRTKCSSTYQDVPYFEDFDSYIDFEERLPQCWDYINNSHSSEYPGNENYPLIANGVEGYFANSYLYFLIRYYDYLNDHYGMDPQDQYVIMPRMENISNLQLKFLGLGEKNDAWTDYNCQVKVGVFDDGGTFHLIRTMEMSRTGYYKNYYVSFEGYEGAGRITFLVETPQQFGSRCYESLVKIDNVSVTPLVSYKKFIADGNWNDPSCWENNAMPASASDDVLIEAAAVIPSGCSAVCGNIELDGNGASITIEDGGQLICSNAVTATVKKSIANATNWGEGNYIPDGWYFFASPFTEDLWPGNVNNMYAGDYDLYRLNNTTWENYKNPVSGYFELVNGQGYLYANRDGVTLEFTGTTKPYTAGYTVEGTGWNLVGNPYTFNAYVNQSHYVLNSTRTAIEAAASNSAAIAPCTGVLVSGNATFYNAPQTQSNNQGNIQIALAQAATTRGNNHAETLDNAIVSFNEGEQLGKFYFGSQNANIYIPQGDEEYAIASSDKQGELPLNFKAKENGSYTITVAPEGVEMNYLHLIDNLTGDDIDLLSTPSYTFNAKTTDYESRFRLVFVCGNVDGDNETFAFFANGQLIINGEGTAQVIDMLGRILINETVKGSASKVIDQPAGIYMIRLINGENVKVQKVVVK